MFGQIALESKNDQWLTEQLQRAFCSLKTHKNVLQSKQYTPFVNLGYTAKCLPEYIHMKYNWSMDFYWGWSKMRGYKMKLPSDAGSPNIWDKLIAMSASTSWNKGRPWGIPGLIYLFEVGSWEFNNSNTIQKTPKLGVFLPVLNTPGHLLFRALKYLARNPVKIGDLSQTCQSVLQLILKHAWTKRNSISFILFTAP